MIGARHRQTNAMYDMVEPSAPVFLYVQQIDIIQSKRFAKRPHKRDRINAFFGVEGPARLPAKPFQQYFLERSKPAGQWKKSNSDACIRFVLPGFIQCRNIKGRIDAVIQQTARIVPRPVVSIPFQITLSALTEHPSKESFEGATAQQHCYVHGISLDG